MPLWAKVDVDMPTDEKLFGQPLATRHLWTCLICLAKRQDHAGAINGYDCALLASRFNIPRKCVALALTHYQAVRMVELDHDGTIRLIHFLERQGDTSVTERREQERNRQEKRRAVTRDKPPVSPVTNGVGHAGVTLLDVEGEEEKEKDQSKALSAKPTEAWLVFDEWRKVHRKQHSKFTSDRERLVKARLKDYPVERLIAAVRGCALDPFSMGKNERQTMYNDLTLICRDGTHVEKFEALAPSNEPAIPEIRRKKDEEILAEVNAEFEAKHGRA